jgi:two-component system nitrogen regulation sensor histidine kinase NtrY
MPDASYRSLALTFAWITVLISGVVLLSWALVSWGLPAAASAGMTAGLAALTVGLYSRSAVRGALGHVRRLARELEKGRQKEAARQTLLYAVVEATPVALLFYADAGRIRFANAESRRLFFEGQSPEGQNFLHLVAHAPEPLRKALLGENDELFNVEPASGDGQRETYHLARRTFPFDGETHTLLVVRQLTFEVSRREVEVLRKVIRIISHELNNSLAPITSLVHSSRVITKNPEHIGKLDRVFDTIEERARHLTTFLNGYATLAKLPKPKQEQVPWEPLLDRLRALHPSARLTPAPAAPAWMDAGQVEQLLINLLKNAAEAGGDPAAIELDVTAEADGAVTVRVSDRGTGLGPEALESAFLPLYSTKEKGSGMGLALCREIAEAHGGRLSIRNRDGGGCVVACRLPARRTPGIDGGSRATLTLTRS